MKIGWGRRSKTEKGDNKDLAGLAWPKKLFKHTLHFTHTSPYDIRPPFGETKFTAGLAHKKYHKLLIYKKC